MILYDRSPAHDLLLARWWAGMRDSGELPSIFQNCDALSRFYELFCAPKVLVFFTDTDGIWLATWFEPVMAGAFMGAWIRPDCRRSRKAARAIYAVYRQALTVWPVLIGVTRHADLRAVHEHIGYISLGTVPHLFGDADAYIHVLTKQTFRDKEY